VTIDAGSSGVSDGTVTEVLPKTSDKVDETYALPFPQTERRELYVLVKPDRPLRRVSATGGELCDIGRWVTITDAAGWAPSTSVLWRSAGAGLNRAARAVRTTASTAWTSLEETVVGSADAAPEPRGARRRSR
jgi:hypothetical protein